MCKFVLQNLVDTIQQEPSMVTTFNNLSTFFPFDFGGADIWHSLSNT